MAPIVLQNLSNEDVERKTQLGELEKMTLARCCMPRLTDAWSVVHCLHFTGKRRGEDGGVMVRQKC